MTAPSPLRTVLLAMRADPTGHPVGLLPVAGTTVIGQLLDALPASTEVEVLTRPGWDGRLREHLGPAVAIGTATTVDELLAHLLTPRGTRDGGDLLLLDAGTVADPLSVGRIADDVAAGTRVMALPDGPHAGSPDADPHGGLRSTRGRVVAAGSVLHDLGAGDAAHGRALRLDHQAQAMLAERSGEIARLVAEDERELVLADPLPLLTVATVRAGAALAPASPLPGGVWRRVHEVEEAATAAAAVDSLDLEDLRLRAAVKAEDGFFTTFFVSTYSRYLARWAAVRGLTPDQVTIASFLLGVLAAAGFATGVRAGWIAGAILLQLAFTLDCVDGQLARYARISTLRGAWLDAVFDRGKEYVAYLGLAIGGIRAGDDAGLWVLAAAVLTLQTVRHMVDLGYDAQQRADAAAASRVPLGQRSAPAASHWEPAAAATSTPHAGVQAGLRRGLSGLRSGERHTLVRWLKRIVILPIGERFALISLVVAVATPRWVFVALLVWGSFALLYTAVGRIVRSMA